jgi:hypothetical protein
LAEQDRSEEVTTQRKIKVHRIRTQPKTLRHFRIGEGLPTPAEITQELEDMRDVLMGRVDPPVSGVLALMEVADAFFARACELEQMILAGVREGRISKATQYQSIRTQEIRSFKELAKSAAELGSRRVTVEQMTQEKERRGMESA